MNQSLSPELNNLRRLKDQTDKTVGRGRFALIAFAFALLSLLSWMTTRDGYADNRASALQQTIPPASSIFSDDFNRCALAPKAWTTIANGGTITMLGQQIEIDVPAGTAHDAWTGGNFTSRIMQPADDTNFEIEAKFDSPLAKRIQLHGFIIEQDADNYLRINVQSTGTGTELLIVRVVDNVADAPIREAIDATTPVYLRVLRWKSSDLWRVSYSFDGLTWDSSATFELTHPLSVTKVGLFAGNAGSNPPAFKSRIDYFFNRANPITPEDPLVNQLDVAIVGDGQVSKTPECGTPVMLTATANPGWDFSGWSGALMGSNPTQTRDIQAGDVVTATFAPKPYSINTTVAGDGQVFRSPDQPYYDANDVVTLTAAASPGWAFDGWTGDLSGQDPSGTITVSKNHQVTATFRPTIIGDAGIQSDDFNQCALDDSTWTFENPASDAQLEANGEQLVLSVPAGVSHDIWKDGIQAPYIWQPVNDNDMGVELKYDSIVSSRYQLQGLLIIEDEQNLLRINVQHDNASAHLLVIRIKDGTPKVLADEPIASGGPVYLRLIRTNSIWSVNYGFDGTNWFSTADMLFTDPMTVAKVGAFVGNAAVASESAPAFSGQLDYFFNMVSPISPEDPVVNHLPVTITGSGQVLKSPACGNPTTVTAVPDSGWAFRGWGGVVTSNQLSESITFERGDRLAALFEPAILVSNLHSDIFNRCSLNESIWQIIDPLGDATVRIADAQQLVIEVPGEVKHDVWLSGIEAPHVMQSVNNADFEAEVKLGAALTEPIQLQGMLIQADAENFIRLNVQSTSGGPEFLVITFVDGAAQIRFQEAIDPTMLYFRVNRSANSWTVQGSSDGTTWQDLTTFDHELDVSLIGLFAGNASNNPPPFTAQFDYFINRAAPLTDESSGGLPLVLTTNGTGSVTKTPDKNLYACGESVTLSPLPGPGWSFDSWGGDATGITNPLTIEMDSDKAIDATFSQDVYTLATNIIGGGSIDLQPLQQSYLHGETVQVTAVESGEWTFVGWSGDLTGANLGPLPLVINANREITATFKKEIYTLILESVGEGQVTISKSGVLSFNDEVTLTATPNAGWQFIGWTLNGTVEAGARLISIEPSLTIRVQNDGTYYANFVKSTTSTPSPDPDPKPDPDGTVAPDDDSASGTEIYLPLLFD